MLHNLVFSFLCSYCLTVNAQFAENSILKSCQPCEDVSSPKATITVHPKTFNPPQIVDITLMTTIMLENQLRMSVKVDMENNSINKNWQHLTTVEDDFCRAIRSYVGPFAYDMETAMGIPTGACPIQKGTYHAINYTLDFSKYRLQAFPFGNLRMTHKIVEKSNRSVVLCQIFIMSNVKLS